jgi:hypothetical protein
MLISRFQIGSFLSSITSGHATTPRSRPDDHARNRSPACEAHRRPGRHGVSADALQISAWYNAGMCGRFTQHYTWREIQESFTAWSERLGLLSPGITSRPPRALTLSPRPSTRMPRQSTTSGCSGMRSSAAGASCRRPAMTNGRRERPANSPIRSRPMAAVELRRAVAARSFL